MNTYKVIWEESHSIIIKAKSADEAIDMVQNTDYQAESDESAEMTMPPEAFLLEIEAKDRTSEEIE